MPYLPMISVVALWVSIANAHDKFMAGAAAPILANLCFIVGAILIPLFASDLGIFLERCQLQLVCFWQGCCS